MSYNADSPKKRFDEALKDQQQPEKETAKKSRIREISFYKGGLYSMKFVSSYSEPWKLYHDRVERYSYYFLGLTVALIGYSFHLANQADFHSELIFFLGALFFWVGGIFFGLQCILNGIDFNRLNFDQLLHQESLNPRTEDEEAEDEMISILDGEMRKKGQAQELNFRRLEYYFYGGLTIFIIWRMMEMALK